MTMADYRNTRTRQFLGRRRLVGDSGRAARALLLSYHGSHMGGKASVVPYRTIGRNHFDHQWEKTRGCSAPSLSHPLAFSLPLNTQYEPCPILTPAAPPLTFNRFSMLPWMRMRRRQKASSSLILLPPSYSPATRPLPSYLCFKI
jgi:hypothetical protein